MVSSSSRFSSATPTVDATRLADVPAPLAATGSESRRIAPSLFQHDYLVLSFLYRDIARGLAMTPPRSPRRGEAVDVGAGGGPYRALLDRAGYTTRTLDIAPGPGVDIVGQAESTGLADASVDLVICTQVLEHARTPWLAMREFARILRPGGSVLFSVPHIWFHHPHPHDYWRMTVEGVVALCEEGDLQVVDVKAQGGSAAALFQAFNFLLYGALGRFGAPLFAIANVAGRGADALVRDSRFTLNHVCVARKPTA